MKLHRRELLTLIAAATGATIIGVDKLAGLLWATPLNPSRFMTKAQIALLDEIGDVIIPETDTPGAKAAQIGQLMEIMVRDCYTPKEQAVFMKGVSTIESKGFMGSSLKDRMAYLVNLEKEANEFNKAQKESEPKHFYTMMKQLTLFGYFTSEIGMTQALRHLPIPGRYDGAFPYKKGDRAFSE